MGCGASAQVGADEENGSQADGNDLQGDNFQSQTAEADGYHHDGLEVGGVDNMSSPYVQPGGAAPLDKTPLPPIRRSTAVDTKSIHSDNFDVGSEQSGTIIFARPKTGMPSFRSPRKLPKLIGGRTPILDNNISDGIANDETIILPASEQNDNPDTEDKATNTLKIVEESDEDDISFGQMADDANIGVRRDAEEEENEEQNGEEENVDDQNGEEQNDEEHNVEQENIEQENIETNNEGIDDFDDVPLENANEEEEIEQGQTEVVEELDANAADIEAELEEQMEKAESVNENKEEDFLGEAPPDEVDQPPDESEEIEEDNIVPVQAGNHHKVSLTVIDDIENDETEAPDEEVADQPADPEDESVEPEIDQPIGNDVNAEQGNEDEDDDDDAGVVYTPAPSRPTSSGSRRTLQIEAASRQSSRLSTVGGNNNVMNDSAGSRPNSATSLAKLSTASHMGSLASLKEVSTASRRGSSASGGTKGDVEDEVDVEEERRSTSRKKVASANRVRIAEGHQLMETPSPLPNDSGADLEADEDGDSKPVDDKGRNNDEENDESGMENQDSDFSQDIPITNLANISRSSSVQVTG